MQLQGERADVLIALFVPKVVVDGAQVVQIEHAQGNRSIFGNGFGVCQQLLALVLVGKPCGLIKVHLLLQDAILRGNADGLRQLDAEQKHQSHDVDDHYRLKLVECGGFFLRVGFGKFCGLVADSEERFAHGDDVGALVAFFAYLRDFVGEGVVVGTELFHLVLEGLIVKAHQIQLVAAVTQAVDVGVDGVDKAILLLLRIFQLHDALGGAADEARVVHYAGGALNVRHELHDVEEQEDEDNRKQRHEETDNAVRLLFLGFGHDPDLAK